MYHEIEFDWYDKTSGTHLSKNIVYCITLYNPRWTL